MKNMLVTGGAGFIGSNFVRHMQNVKPNLNIVNLDALTYAGSLENLQALPNPERHFFVEGNICSGDLVYSLLRKYKVDTIVHFAAESHVDRSIDFPGVFVQTNVIGTLTLLEAARHAGNVRFLHVSTDEVFGSLSPGESGFTEQSSYSPNSPYAASKAASDHLVRAFAQTYGMAVFISNCSNNYGPYQFPEKLIPLTILNAIQAKPIPIYGDGKQVRDWLHVEDHCRAVELILDKGKTGETYNLGSNTQSTNLEIVEKICRILDMKKPRGKPYGSLIELVADRPGHDRRYAMDSTKARVELGWHPAFSLDNGLEATVSWYVDNADWVKEIQKKEDYQDWLAKHYGTQKAQV